MILIPFITILGLLERERKKKERMKKKGLVPRYSISKIITHWPHLTVIPHILHAKAIKSPKVVVANTGFTTNNNDAPKC